MKRILPVLLSLLLVDRVRRKLRGWLPANHSGGGQRDDGHPGGHHPGCAGAG